MRPRVRGARSISAILLGLAAMSLAAVMVASASVPSGGPGAGRSSSSGGPRGATAHVATVVRPAGSPPIFPPAAVRGLATAATSVQWFNFTSSVHGTPEKRDRETLCYDVADGYTVMFGGYDPAGAGWLGDTWTYQAKTWTMLAPIGGPSARSSASMVYDPALNGCLLFGGFYYTTDTYYSQTWLFAGGSWQPISTANAPLPRSEAAMAWDPAVGAVILYGGLNDTTTFGDTWAFTGSDWQLQTGIIAPPPARSAGSMAFDNATQSLIMTDGHSGGGGLLAETWSYAAGQWNQVFPVVAPRAGSYTESATLPNGSVLVVGLGNTTFENWVYANGTWAKISPPNNPSLRNDGALVYDASDGYLLMFGGIIGTNHWISETWAFDMSHLAFGTFNTSGLAPFTYQPYANESYGAGPVSIGWTFGPLGSGIGTHPTYVFNTGGNFAVTVTSQDALHLAVSLATAVKVTLPVTVAVAPGTGGEAPLTVTAVATAHNGSAPYHVTWDFGDGTTGAGPTATHTYTAGGTFTVSASVVDGAGAAGSGATTYTILPTLNASIQASVTHGPGPLTVTFTSGPTGGLPPYTYAWNFGDGAVGTGPSVTHTFAVAGNVTVTLTVTDQYARTSNATVVVTVEGGSSGTGSSSAGPLGLSVTEWLLVGLLLAVVVGVTVLLLRRRPPAAAPVAPPEE